MKIPKSLAMLFCAALLLLTSNLKADEWNKETKITFSGPVQIEKTQLPAGTYVFKLADTADRHVVQIFNEDQTQIIATLLAIPEYRVEPTGKTVVKFAETNDDSEATGELPVTGVPIKEWFYPGDNFGNEFRVMPQQYVAVAQPAPPPPAPAAQPAPPSPVAAAPSAPEEPPAAPEAQPAPASVAPEQQPTPTQLPQTASQMALEGLIGAIALGCAFSLRLIFFKKSA